MTFTEDELNEFKIEALELLDSAEKGLLAIEAGGTVTANYDSIFRAFHNIKGAAGIMELEALQTHVHQLENLLIQFKDKGTIPNHNLELFLRGTDAARELLAGKDVAFSFAVSAPVEARRPLHLVEAVSRFRTVIVDDEPDVVDVLTELLAHAGFDTRGTTSPKEALELVDTFSPHVIFSDIRMPEMDGPEGKVMSQSLKAVRTGVAVAGDQYDEKGKLDAIYKSQAVIEFDLDGTVVTANENFLKTLGYSLSEIQGKHHRMFCESEGLQAP